MVNALALAEIRSNIIRMAGLQGSSHAALEVQSWDATQQGTPPNWDSNYNLLDANDRDYEDRVALAGEQDKNNFTGENTAWFQGLIDPATGSVSFMLRDDLNGSSPCYPNRGTSVESDAIDRGRADDDWEDAIGGPGLGTDTNDVGAYGGPANFWDPNEAAPCFEYRQGVGQRWSAP